jgi:hypothetical protein
LGLELSGGIESEAVFVGCDVVGKMKTRQKEVGFQVLVGAAQKLSRRSMRERSERFLLLPAPLPRLATKSMPRGKKATPISRA